MTIHVVTLCTGNAARSVMAGVVVTQRLPDAVVTTSGTHVIEGMPMSWRTRNAIAALDLPVPSHRSRQATEPELDRADIVLAMAGDHVAWMRRTHPAVAGRTATLRRLVRDLGEGARPLADRLADLRLGEVELEEWEDVIDPAGGDEDLFVATAREISTLISELAARLHQ